MALHIKRERPLSFKRLSISSLDLDLGLLLTESSKPAKRLKTASTTKHGVNDDKDQFSGSRASDDESLDMLHSKLPDDLPVDYTTYNYLTTALPANSCYRFCGNSAQAKPDDGSLETVSLVDSLVLSRCRKNSSVERSPLVNNKKEAADSRH